MRTKILISILLLFVVALSATFLSPIPTAFTSESPPGYQNETHQTDSHNYPGTVSQDVELSSSTIRTCDTQANRYDTTLVLPSMKAYKYWNPGSVYTLPYS